jgi:holo-[acyl-carrier protein] synthase
MIIGHGIDIVEIARFNTARINRLAERILTTVELADYYNTHSSRQQTHIAKMWAAKEAVSKAFGTGIRESVVWKNIEMTKDELDCPHIKLLNGLDKNNTVKCHISISHDGGYLVASAILEQLNDR